MRSFPWVSNDAMDMSQINEAFWDGWYIPLILFPSLVTKLEVILGNQTSNGRMMWPLARLTLHYFDHAHFIVTKIKIPPKISLKCSSNWSNILSWRIPRFMQHHNLVIILWMSFYNAHHRLRRLKIGRALSHVCSHGKRMHFTSYCISNNTILIPLLHPHDTL